MERIWGRPALQPLTLQLAALAAVAAVAFFNPSLAMMLGALCAAAWLRGDTLPVLRREAAGWWLAALLPLVVLAAAVGTQVPIASDDLLRDIAVARYGFDYRAMYPLSAPQLPDFSLWWGFDRLLAAISGTTGALPAVWLAQGAAGVGLAAVLLLAGRWILPASPDRPFWVGIGVLLVFGLTLHRVLLARPELFLATWAVAAVLARTPGRIALWCLAGLAASAAYWLMPLYLPAVLLLKARWTHRFVIAALLCAFHVGLWHVLSDGTYLQTVLWLPQALGDQVATVAENASLAGYILLWPFALLLAGAVLAAASASTARAPLLLAVYFAASDQVRYVSVVAPLLLLAAWAGLAARPLRLPDAVRLGLLVVLPLLALQLAGRTSSLKDSPTFDLPTGSLTLTAFGHAAYAVPFFARGKPTVEPSYALGAAPLGVQTLSYELLQGRLNCTEARRWKFTNVLERTLTEAPPCLVLVGVQGPWRLWALRSDP